MAEITTPIRLPATVAAPSRPSRAGTEYYNLMNTGGPLSLPTISTFLIRPGRPPEQTALPPSTQSLCLPSSGLRSTPIFSPSPSNSDRFDSASILRLSPREPNVRTYTLLSTESDRTYTAYPIRRFVKREDKGGRNIVNSSLLPGKKLLPPAIVTTKESRFARRKDEGGGLIRGIILTRIKKTTSFSRVYPPLLF